MGIQELYMKNKESHGGSRIMGSKENHGDLSVMQSKKDHGSFLFILEEEDVEDIWFNMIFIEKKWKDQLVSYSHNFDNCVIFWAQLFLVFTEIWLNWLRSCRKVNSHGYIFLEKSLSNLNGNW